MAKKQDPKWRHELLKDLVKRAKQHGIQKFDRQQIEALVDELALRDANRGFPKKIKKHYVKATSFKPRGKKKLLTWLEQNWPGHTPRPKRKYQKSKKKEEEAPHPDAPPPPPGFFSEMPFPDKPTWTSAYCSALGRPGCGELIGNCKCYNKGGLLYGKKPQAIMDLAAEFNEPDAPWEEEEDAPPPPPADCGNIPLPPSSTDIPDLFNEEATEDSSSEVVSSSSLQGPAVPRPTPAPSPPHSPTCAACGDTGKNSKGGDCVPCKKNKRLEAPLPPKPSGKTYGGAKEGTVKGHKHRVCFSVKLNGSHDKAVVIEQLHSYVVEKTDFEALVKDATPIRDDGWWDILVHYSVNLVRIYEAILAHESVVDAAAKAAADFGVATEALQMHG